MTSWVLGVAGGGALLAAAASGFWLAGPPEPSVPVRVAPDEVPTWSDPSLVFEVFAGTDARWGDADILTRLGEAARTWSDQERTGSRVQFVLRVHREQGVAARDGKNAIVFRDDRWCPPGKQKRSQCYPDAQPARTQTYVETHAGRKAIVEADIQINAVSFDWQKSPQDYGGVPAGELRSAAPPTSLSALMVHEFAHALGLEHPCAVGWFAEHAASLPRCASAAEHVRSSTLYPLSFWGEPSPPPLSDDVLAFLQRTYPR